GRAPDAVQRRLELAEDGRRADEGEHEADGRRHEALPGLVRAFHHALDGGRALRTDEPADLVEKLAPGRRLAEEEASDRDDDDKQRGEREERVEGDGRAHAGGGILDPGEDGIAGKSPGEGGRQG